MLIHGQQTPLNTPIVHQKRGSHRKEKRESGRGQDWQYLLPNPLTPGKVPQRMFKTKQKAVSTCAHEPYKES